MTYNSQKWPSIYVTGYLQRVRRMWAVNLEYGINIAYLVKKTFVDKNIPLLLMYAIANRQCCRYMFERNKTRITSPCILQLVCPYTTDTVRSLDSVIMNIDATFRLLSSLINRQMTRQC